MKTKYIKGYGKRYTIDEKARVWSNFSKRYLCTYKNIWGYLFIGLSKNNILKNYSQHRLVAKAFIPNPNKYPFINHKDGNKENNNIENLEWCTRVQNNLHAREVLGMNTAGENNGNTILTKEQVKEIRSLQKRRVIGYTKNIAKRFGVSDSHIRHIWNGERWRSTL